jgi:hypothetical protein
MLSQRLWIAVRLILVGWTTLFPIAFLMEHSLLLWAASLLGAKWYPTVRVGLDALALAATGWVIGRFHRSAPILGVLAFAATLTFWDLTPVLAINVPWLIRLAGDATRDSLYLGSLLETAGEHVLLFGSLIVGALLSRTPRTPVSLFGGGAR